LKTFSGERDNTWLKSKRLFWLVISTASKKRNPIWHSIKHTANRDTSLAP
jgi:hypothetical protein